MGILGHLPLRRGAGLEMELMTDQAFVRKPP